MDVILPARCPNIPSALNPTYQTPTPNTHLCLTKRCPNILDPTGQINMPGCSMLSAKHRNAVLGVPPHRTACAADWTQAYVAVIADGILEKRMF